MCDPALDAVVFLTFRFIHLKIRQHSFAEIDHEIFSTVILSLPLIQEGKLSVTCERMCTEYWLTD